MRAAKLQTRITYTHEQIEEIKRKAANEALDRARDEVKKEVRKYLDAEFEERQKLLKGETAADTTLQLLTLTMAIPVMVLCRPNTKDADGRRHGFGWKVMNGSHDGQKKLQRFVDEVMSEVNGIFGDETADIRRYAEKCYEECGVRYKLDEEGGNADGKGLDPRPEV